MLHAMRALFIVAACFAFAGCAAGRCYTSGEPMCLTGSTRCEYDKQQKCKVCTCDNNPALNGPAANTKPGP